LKLLQRATGIISRQVFYNPLLTYLIAFIAYHHTLMIISTGAVVLPCRHMAIISRDSTHA
jgi:hypothetical protein